MKNNTIDLFKKYNLDFREFTDCLLVMAGEEAIKATKRLNTEYWCNYLIQQIHEFVSTNAGKTPCPIQLDTDILLEFNEHENEINNIKKYILARTLILNLDVKSRKYYVAALEDINRGIKTTFPYYLQKGDTYDKLYIPFISINIKNFVKYILQDQIADRDIIKSSNI